MRIIAGRFKGRRLAGPAGAGVRPTSDRLRETLFDILGDTVEGRSVLDACAGTGALGLEAVSRGASRATFVERDRREAGVLAENIRRCGAENACVIVICDFLAGSGPGDRGGARRSARLREGDRFDLVLLDPPYDIEDLDAVIDAAASRVAPGGSVVLEHRRRRPSPDRGPAGLVRTRIVEAGDSALSFYQAPHA